MRCKQISVATGYGSFRGPALKVGTAEMGSEAAAVDQT